MHNGWQLWTTLSVNLLSWVSQPGIQSLVLKDLNQWQPTQNHPTCPSSVMGEPARYSVFHLERLKPTATNTKLPYLSIFCHGWTKIGIQSLVLKDKPMASIRQKKFSCLYHGYRNLPFECTPRIHIILKLSDCTANNTQQYTSTLPVHHLSWAW